MSRRVSVLGATGSVGRAALAVVAGNPELHIAGLCARRNVDALAEAARTMRAEFAAIADESLYERLKARLAGSGTEAGAGDKAVCEAARRDADCVVCAISGTNGLEATAAAMRSGALIALANKEALVCAGPILMAMARQHKTRIIPVDSEHNAIFQVLTHPDKVEKLILTASGGPFRSHSKEEMDAVTPAEACAHPTWNMGAKISVDSATMMNKGLEVIEAVHLFGIASERITIVVHPQSIIHSLIAYLDGSVLAQMGMPDMRTPISYALAFPERMPLPEVERLDLASVGRLDFAPPDPVRFPSLSIARDALEATGWGPIVLCAANDSAVHGFLRGDVRFPDIARTSAMMLDRFADGAFGPMHPPETLAEVQNLISLCRQETGKALHTAG